MTRAAVSATSASTDAHDVIIVGAGLAGCAAAILFSRWNLDILLLDKKRSEDDYKPTCTTFIQPSALPVIRKLGIERRLEDLGAIRNGAVFWTPYGWIRDTLERDETYKHGYSIQRSKLDPMLLAAARASGRVTVRLGARLHELVEDGRGNFLGIAYRDSAAAARAARAPLIVLADGRNSHGARLAAVPTVYRTNNRFVFFAYYRNMPLRTGKTAQFYQKGRDMGFVYPFDDGLTMLCCFVTKDQYEQWQGNKVEALETFFDDLPEAPDRSDAKRVSKVIGMRHLNDFKRPAVHRNVALIGDACMACDPMSGVGCGFAFQSADWLAEQVGPALAEGRELARPLRAYHRIHRRQLLGHEYFIQDNSTGRKMNLLESMIAKAAVADPYIAQQLHLFIARVINWKQFLKPYNVFRILKSSIVYGRNREHFFRHEIS